MEKRKIVYGAVVCVIVSLLVVLARLTGTLNTLENYSWDLRARRLAGTPDPRIKLVLLDQSSLDWGKEVHGWSWPWPREVYGALLSYFRQSTARALAFDVLYTEPSPYGVSDDRRFSEELADTPQAILAAIPSDKMGDSQQWPAAAPTSPFSIAGLDSWMAAHPAADWVQPRAAFSLPEIISGVKLFGHVRGVVDSDYVTRRVLPVQIFDSQVLPLLGLAAYAAGGEGPNGAGEPATLSIAGDKLIVGSRELPLDSSGRTILRFRRPQQVYGGRAYESFSMAAIVESALLMQQGEEPTVPLSEFADSYVFVGFSAPALYDLKPTPFDNAVPGVVVHATLLDNLLAGDAISEVPEWRSLALIVALSALGAFTGLLSFSATKLACYFGLLLILPPALGFLAYDFGYWLPVVAPTLAVALSCMGSMMVNYSTEGRQRRFIKRAFEHYLSRVVVDQIVADPSRLSLGGERREISVFFSDLEGFSRISERMDATELTQLLNDYLTEMTDIILDEEGTLDKYEGDAIIAFWNAPLEQPDHALRACRAALRCQQRLSELRAEYEKRTGAVLKMRIGLNTGIAVVGNLGSLKRFDYTMLGDAVNLASRLEGANKNFGTYMMVSKETWQQARREAAGSNLISRCIGSIRVLGREQAVEVYELLDPANARPEALDRFERARQYFLAEAWDDADREFAELGYGDPLVASYRAEIARLRSSPPQNWDGVWQLTSK